MTQEYFYCPKYNGQSLWSCVLDKKFLLQYERLKKKLDSFLLKFLILLYGLYDYDSRKRYQYFRGLFLILLHSEVLSLPLNQYQIKFFFHLLQLLLKNPIHQCEYQRAYPIDDLCHREAWVAYLAVFG